MNAQSGNFQVLFLSLVAWGKQLENLRAWEGFLMEMVERLSRSKAGLDLGWQTEELMLNILPHDYESQHTSTTLAPWQMAHWAYWEECGQQAERVDR